VAPAASAPAEDAPADPRAELRARLAERGLLREQPAVRIREVAGEAPPRPLPDLEPVASTESPIVPDDAEELEPEPPGPTVTVRCRGCRSTQEVAATTSGYRCRSCSKTWRWAICAHCDVLTLTLARQESWRCAGCGEYSRSWWRTPDGRRQSPTIGQRRQDDEVRRQRAAAYERARNRRWKLVATGVVMIAATVTWSVLLSDRSVRPTERGPSGRVCSTAADLRTSFGSETVSPAEVRASLDDLAATANDAIPEVRLAAQRWAASGLPGDKTFEAAAKDVARACAGDAPPDAGNR
jgi:hypothetical protein